MRASADSLTLLAPFLTLSCGCRLPHRRHHRHQKGGAQDSANNRTLLMQFQEHSSCGCRFPHRRRHRHQEGAAQDSANTLEASRARGAAIAETNLAAAATDAAAAGAAGAAGDGSDNAGAGSAPARRPNLARRSMRPLMITSGGGELRAPRPKQPPPSLP